MVKLNRAIGKWQILFFGIGTIVGAGIYALIGQIVGIAGDAAPIAVFISFLVAAFTAHSYACFSKISSSAAGEAQYIYMAFPFERLKQIVAVTVAAAGIISCSTLVSAFAGYFHELYNVGDNLTILGLCFFLLAITLYGIRESICFAVIITIIEIFGILLVLASSSANIFSVEISSIDLSRIGVAPILSAAFLAFYAFIGFEDIVNMSEETKDSRFNIPFAIYGSLVIALILYVLVAFAAMSSLSPHELASAKDPMALIYRNNGGNPDLLRYIAMIAIINGALAQILMSSRILYGSLPYDLIRKVNKDRKTPTGSTILSATTVPILSLLFNLEALARTTSYIILSVFLLVNVSLIVVLRKNKNRPIHGLFPLIGTILISALFIFEFTN